MNESQVISPLSTNTFIIVLFLSQLGHKKKKKKKKKQRNAIDEVRGRFIYEGKEKQRDRIRKRRKSECRNPTWETSIYLLLFYVMYIYIFFIIAFSPVFVLVEILEKLEVFLYEWPLCLWLMTCPKRMNSNLMFMLDFTIVFFYNVSH